MGRTTILVVAMAVVLTACGDSTPEQAPAQATEREQLAAELRDLEPAPGEDWDRDAVLAALTAARRLFVLGWDGDPPINMTRLVGWLGRNPGAVTQEDRDRIMSDGEGTALGIRAVPAAFTDHEALQREYVRLAEEAEDAFRTLTGHGLGVGIYVALSDLPLFDGDIYAASTSHELVDLWPFFGAVRYVEFVADYEATIGEEPACLIILGTKFTDEFTARRQAAGLMHEITHCHQHRIHPSGVAGHFSTQVLWMDEGYASWAGEAFVGGTEQSTRWWDEYLPGINKGFQLYPSSYAAIGFFSHLEASGVDVWANFIDYFTGVRNSGSDTARYEALVAPLDADKLGRWASGPARHPEWSAAWEAEGPGITAAAREPKVEPLEAGDVLVLEALEAEPSLHRIEVDPPTDGTYIVGVAATGAGRLRWSWGPDTAIVDGFAEVWQFGNDPRCEDGTNPVPKATVAPASATPPRLYAALVGPPSDFADLTITMDTIEDICDNPAAPVLLIAEAAPPPPAAVTTTTPTTTTSSTTTSTTSTISTTTTTTTIPPDLAACLVGTWIPDEMQLQAYIITLYQAALASPTFLGGQMLLELTDDGTVSITLDSIQFTYDVPTGDRGEAVFNGGSLGTWEVAGSELTVEIDTVTTTVDLTVGSAPISPGPTTNPGGIRVVQAACGGHTLVIEPDVTATSELWPLPTEWTRLS